MTSGGKEQKLLGQKPKHKKVRVCCEKHLLANMNSLSCTDRTCFANSNYGKDNYSVYCVLAKIVLVRFE